MILEDKEFCRCLEMAGSSYHKHSKLRRLINCDNKTFSLSDFDFNDLGFMHARDVCNKLFVMLLT